jgi:MFS superfamily sulfate permease-like transporter
MKPSSLPTFREFLQENKNVCKSHVPSIIFLFGFTIIGWFLNILDIQGLRGKILGVFPTHYFPEWVTLFYIGFFMAKLKKTLVPTALTVAILYLIMVPLNFVLLGFQDIFYLFFLMLMGSPLLIGYLWSYLRNSQ